MASKIMVLTLLIFALLICTVSTGDSLPREYDYRIISYQDLQSSSQTYSNSKIKEYMSLTLDIPRKQLIAGARNHILRLALDSLEPLEVEEWGTRNITRQICRAKGQSEENCHNFVKVLMRHGNQLFACGTNAFSPQCSVRELTNLGSVIKLEDGAAKCPYNPHHNSTTLMTQEGDVYTATVMDFAARDVAIYRNTGPSPVLRTVQYNSKWLNEPVFVSSYEIGELVFFFFRETATEFINCGKSVYPRVAKVCKNDKGGEFLWKDNWTTFQKARLNCSIPGDYPFYYNELQSTYYQKEKGLVYMVFTTPVSSMYGSAVCVYNMTAFQRAFEGPFKYQESSKHAWTQHENPFPNYRCESIKERKAGMSQTDIGNAQKYQMMDSAVQPVSLHPFATTTNERWSHIVVDTVEGKHKSEFQVMFLVNKEGVLKKIVHLPNKTEACVLEEINIFPEGQKRPVYNMELFNGNIYISTSGEVIKIQVHRCDRFKTRKSCLLSMDPYCGWSSKENKCVRPPRGHTRAHYWHQRQINRCPVMDYPINGEWSPWASWSSCGQVGEYSPGDQCLCRSRSCDKPAPMFGGKKCDGSNIQVTNCTRHGGWTVWSTWSACSQSCGTAMRSRTRSCSNPAPQFGGRVCIGQERIDENCVNNPSCPVPTKIPLDGGWTRWTEWEGCTAQCGGGFQRRYRSCTNPPPQNGGVHCDGNNEQWKTCNTGTCNEIRKSSAWTGWVIRNITNGGFIKQRFQFTCRASVPLDSALKEPAIRMQERFCLEGGEDCSDSAQRPNINGSWSSWMPWSECNADCNGGIQRRQRSCTNPPPSGNGKDCVGLPIETRECNSHSCQGVWSCWSDFSACSVTCGRGRHFRMRTCSSSVAGKTYTIPCAGSEKEEEACFMPACGAIIQKDGWLLWTDWGPCTENYEQIRQRTCTLALGCEGPEEETRMCNEITNMAAVVGGQDTGIQVVHVVVVALAAFLLGGVISVGLFLYIRHFRRSKEEIKQNKQNKMLYDSKPHLHPFPSFPSNMDVTQQNGNNPRYYSTGSLTLNNKDKMTVKEATLKRTSLMRTNLSLTDQEL